MGIQSDKEKKTTNANIVEHCLKVFVEMSDTLMRTMTPTRSRKSAATDYTQIV